MSVDQGFDNWLVKKLETLDIDDEILGSYISSVVTSDDSYSEKKDTLKDIMLGVTKDLDIDVLCSEVLDKWSDFLKKTDTSDEQDGKVDVALKVSLIMEQQAQSVLKVVNRSSEEEKLREAILSRCTYVSSEEECDDSEDGAVSTSQNQNVEAIAQAEKERREKMKTEAEKKKAQDKVNREKQKQKQDERREKERKRTQKREHKR